MNQKDQRIHGVRITQESERLWTSGQWWHKDYSYYIRQESWNSFRLYWKWKCVPETTYLINRKSYSTLAYAVKGMNAYLQRTIYKRLHEKKGQKKT